MRADGRRRQRFAILAASLPQLPIEPVDILGAQPGYRKLPEPRLDVPAHEVGRLQRGARGEVRRRILEPPLQEFADRTTRRQNTGVIGGRNHCGERPLRFPFPALKVLDTHVSLRLRGLAQVHTKLPGVSPLAHRALHVDLPSLPFVGEALGPPKRLRPPILVHPLSIHLTTIDVTRPYQATGVHCLNCPNVTARHAVNERINSLKVETRIRIPLGLLAKLEVRSEAVSERQSRRRAW